MLLTDPQVYRILHGRHHAEVNSWEDHEFHPLGNIQRVSWRRLYNSLEILFGVVFVVVVLALVVPRHPLYRAKYRRASQWFSLAVWVAFLTGVGFASGVALGVSAKQVIVAYALMYGLGSFFLHQSQLVEHGNLIVAGEWSQRNLKTRNLRRRTLLERVFLFLTHNDSREHVLHHTLVRVYSRPFPGRVPLPPQAVVVSLREYLGILGDMVLGRSSRE
jgi:fatty acid desaturase